MEFASYEPRFPEWMDCRKVLHQAMTNALQDAGNAHQHLTRANQEINKKLEARLSRLRQAGREG